MLCNYVSSEKTKDTEPKIAQRTKRKILEKWASLGEQHLQPRDDA